MLEINAFQHIIVLYCTIEQCSVSAIEEGGMWPNVHL